MMVFSKQCLRSAALISAWWMASFAWAGIEVYEFDSPEQEAQYRELVDQLRCPKCQNQNLADSDAPLAKDLKNKIYSQVQAGESNEAVVAYMVERYGDFVRYRPPFDSRTWLLWLTPVVLACIFFIILSRVLRGQLRGGATERSAENVGLDGGDIHRRATELRRQYSTLADDQSSSKK